MRSQQKLESTMRKSTPYGPVWGVWVDRRQPGIPPRLVLGVRHRATRRGYTKKIEQRNFAAQFATYLTGYTRQLEILVTALRST